MGRVHLSLAPTLWHLRCDGEQLFPVINCHERGHLSQLSESNQGKESCLLYTLLAVLDTGWYCHPLLSLFLNGGGLARRHRSVLFSPLKLSKNVKRLPLFYSTDAMKQLSFHHQAGQRK